MTADEKRLVAQIARVFKASRVIMRRGDKVKVWRIGK